MRRLHRQALPFSNRKLAQIFSTVLWVSITFSPPSHRACAVYTAIRLVRSSISWIQLVYAYAVTVPFLGQRDLSCCATPLWATGIHPLPSPHNRVLSVPMSRHDGNLSQEPFIVAPRPVQLGCWLNRFHFQWLPPFLLSPLLPFFLSCDNLILTSPLLSAAS